MSLPVGRPELDVICRHVAEAWPREACGVVLEREAARHVRTCANAHATPDKAFRIGAADLLAIAHDVQQGWRVAVIYHSHVEAAPTFSNGDRHGALVDGQPAYPDATHLVIAAYLGYASRLAAYRWDPDRKDFVEVA